MRAAYRLLRAADSNAAGTHPHPILTDGQSTTLSSTVTNTGKSPLTGVSFTPQAPAGWTATATTATTVANLAPGKSATARWTVTPSTNAVGGYQLRVSAAYRTSDAGSGTVRADQYVQAQPLLPVQSGEQNPALTATPSASFTSPFEHVTAINDGIYPTAPTIPRTSAGALGPNRVSSGQSWTGLSR